MESLKNVTETMEKIQGPSQIIALLEVDYSEVEIFLEKEY